MGKKILLWLGTILSAILASFCCIVPLILSILGQPSLGFGWGLIEYRPYFLIATFTFLGLAFYFTYRRREIPEEKVGELSKDQRAIKGTKMVNPCCAGGVMRGRGSKIALWIVLALALGLLVYPYIHTAETEVITSGRDSSDLEVVIVGASCCNPAFAPLDEEVEENVEKALRGLNITSKLEIASISEILFKGKGGGLSPKGISKVKDAFGEYNLRALPFRWFW